MERQHSKRHRLHTEDDLQKMVFQWIRLMERRVSEFAMAFHCPNGGSRNPREAARFKGMGVRPGVPDIMLPCPGHSINGQYWFDGLAIELKSKTGRLTGEQSMWLGRLKDECGWRTEVCRTFDEAKAVLCEYMGVKP